MMVFVGQVGMSPTGEETVGLGDLSLYIVIISFPPQPHLESYPSASCVCRADVTASMGSRSQGTRL